MPVSKSNPKLVVEEGTIKADQAIQYPRGRVIYDPKQEGVAARVETYRFNKDGKLVAKNGVPLTNEPQPITGETDAT